MNTQQQMEYKDQINNYINFSSMLNKYTRRQPDLVNYALTTYRKKFFALDESPLSNDEINDEIRNMVKDEAARREIDRLNNKYQYRGFFTASIISFFNRKDDK